MFNKRAIITSINTTGLQQHVETMSEIRKMGEMVSSRPTKTSVEKQCYNSAATWMNEACMQTNIDNVGNLVQSFKKDNRYLPVLMMGTHFDKKPYKERFNGIAGVLPLLE